MASSPDLPPTHGLKRVKKSRSQRYAANQWLSHYRLPLALAGCLVGGCLFLLNPWDTFIPFNERANSTWVNLETWLAYAGGSQLIGGLLLLASFPLGIFWLRRTMLYNDRFWRRSGCPKCGGDELRRTQRQWRDKLLNQMGLPVRRYICASCHWIGGRIDEGHL